VYGDGHSEELIARAMKEWNGDVCIAHQDTAKKSGMARQPRNPPADRVPGRMDHRRHERSLSKLNVETIDFTTISRLVRRLGG